MYKRLIDNKKQRLYKNVWRLCKNVFGAYIFLWKIFSNTNCAKHARSAAIAAKFWTTVLTFYLIKYMHLKFLKLRSEWEGFEPSI